MTPPYSSSVCPRHGPHSLPSYSPPPCQPLYRTQYHPLSPWVEEGCHPWSMAEYPQPAPQYHWSHEPHCAPCSSLGACRTGPGRQTDPHVYVPWQCSGMCSVCLTKCYLWCQMVMIYVMERRYVDETWLLQTDKELTYLIVGFFLTSTVSLLVRLSWRLTEARLLAGTPRRALANPLTISMLCRKYKSIFAFLNTIGRGRMVSGSLEHVIT